MRRKAWRGFLFFAGFSILLAACGTDKQEKVGITLIHGWGTMEQDHITMRQIYKDFEKENPDVQLNLLSMPSSQKVINKANDMLSVGEIPDIIFAGGYGKDVMYRFMVDKGLAVDIMPYVRTDADFAADISPSISRYWETKDGNLYTVSDVLLYSGGYWYNEEILRNAGIANQPATLDEFHEMCRKIVDWAKEENADVIPFQLDAECCMYIADFLLLSAGRQSTEAILSHKMNVIQPEFSNVLKKLEIMDSYSKYRENSYTYRDLLKQFNEGKTAIYFNGIWAGAMIEKDMEVKYAVLPSNSKETVSCISSCLGYVVGNTGDEKKMEASIRFIKYMVSDVVQERILRETGQMPSNPAIQIAKYKDSMPRFVQAVEMVQSADIHVEVPDNIWNDEKSGIFRDYIMDVINGNVAKQTLIDLIR